MFRYILLLNFVSVLGAKLHEEHFDWHLQGVGVIQYATLAPRVPERMIVASDTLVSGLDSETGLIRWRIPLGFSTQVSSLVSHGALITVGTRQGDLMCLLAKTGVLHYARSFKTSTIQGGILAIEGEDKDSTASSEMDASGLNKILTIQGPSELSLVFLSRYFGTVHSEFHLQLNEESLDLTSPTLRASIQGTVAFLIDAEKAQALLLPSVGENRQLVSNQSTLILTLPARIVGFDAPLVVATDNSSPPSHCVQVRLEDGTTQWLTVSEQQLIATRVGSRDEIELNCLGLSDWKGQPEETFKKPSQSYDVLWTEATASSAETRLRRVSLSPVSVKTALHLTPRPLLSVPSTSNDSDLSVLFLWPFGDLQLFQLSRQSTEFVEKWFLTVPTAFTESLHFLTHRQSTPSNTFQPLSSTTDSCRATMESSQSHKLTGACDLLAVAFQSGWISVYRTGFSPPSLQWRRHLFEDLLSVPQLLQTTRHELTQWLSTWYLTQSKVSKSKPESQRNLRFHLSSDPNHPQILRASLRIGFSNKFQTQVTLTYQSETGELLGQMTEPDYISIKDTTQNSLQFKDLRKQQHTVMTESSTDTKHLKLFPSQMSSSQSSSSQPTYYYTVDEATGSLHGFLRDQPTDDVNQHRTVSAKLLWSLQLRHRLVLLLEGPQHHTSSSSVQKALRFTTKPKGPVTSGSSDQPETEPREVRRVYPLGHVLIIGYYKDSEAINTSSQHNDSQTSLVVLAIHAQTGAILSSLEHPNVQRDSSPTGVLCDNVLLYSFSTNASQQQQHVSIWEFFTQMDSTTGITSTNPGTSGAQPFTEKDIASPSLILQSFKPSLLSKQSSLRVTEQTRLPRVHQRLLFFPFGSIVTWDVLQKSSQHQSTTVKTGTAMGGTVVTPTVLILTTSRGAVLTLPLNELLYKGQIARKNQRLLSNGVLESDAIDLDNERVVSQYTRIEPAIQYSSQNPMESSEEFQTRDSNRPEDSEEISIQAAAFHRRNHRPDRLEPRPQFRIATGPTPLSSSSHLAVGGSDLWYARVSEGKPFDVLPSSFSKETVASVLSGLFLCVWLIHQWVLRKQLGRKWE